jgi:hypothetical protein
VSRTPIESLDRAQELLDVGLAFRAHEVLEDAWKASPANERELWRGLAQLAVGITHAARGNLSGARLLLLRGAESLADFHGQPPHEIAVDSVRDWARATADALPSEGTPTLPPPRLRRV